MAIDFNQTQCQSNTTEALFGLCDDEDSKPAYISHNKEIAWNATVVNDNNVDVMFTAIDNCIDIRRQDGNLESRCDGMLTYPDNIVFVELKNQRADWITDGINQLDATIDVYKANADILSIRKRRAVVVNKRHPHFQKLGNEMMQRFFSKHRVRLHIGGTIKI